MLSCLILSIVAGLLLGSQIPYFPLATFFALLLIALVCVALERFALLPARQVTWCYGLLLIGVV